MRIPEEIISRISAATDIVSVISESVMLKKSGMNFFGLCPFHSEKTSSFSVSPHKQIFYCFGCGAGGNVFSYLMKYHGISFPEAVKMAGNKCGIAIETEPLSPEKERHMMLREGLYRLNQQAMLHYTHLLTQTPSGEHARNYLEQRGITRDTIKELNLGYSPNRWDDMVLFLKQHKVTKAMAQASGFVLSRRETKGYYDRFRNRIMFPIFDVTRQVAGFGGRVMDDAVPKYLNSPETPVYSKGRILYGLHLSKIHCRQEDTVYIVEGYFDFISLYQCGIKNCVATLGTALSDSHVRLLKGAASRAFLVFDSDMAGINAAKRSIGTFLKEGLDVRIIILPQGQDPDSFVQQNGKSGFEACAKKAMSVIPFLTRAAVDQFGLSVEGKIKIIQEMKEHLARVDDPAARSLYIHELSQTLNIDETAVLEKVRTAFLESAGVSDIAYLPRQDGDTAPETGMEKESARREKQMISMMLQFPHIRKKIEQMRVLERFYSRELKKIGGYVLDMEGDENMVPRLMEVLETDTQRRLVASLSMEEVPHVDHVDAKVEFLINRIVKIWNKNENSLTTKIKIAEQDSDSSLSFDLLARRQREIRKLRGYE
ncbi:DNA primase [Desulfocicer vacuolatum DSM 3385]|uniref:DNA primase n=1 Tax=Desulfocicer vacuolatum DSM 3385 TaxID=1121400 RepID=A0A1W2B7U0_9BACT|nr:DNA primase [Desulfocicer vacuolatum]SMC68996.1 DNA primase [Desulfocicer vacuolatum DSM 3385]